MAVLACSSIGLSAFPQAAFLDPSFSGDGTLVFPNGNGPTSGRSHLITGDGRIVLAGASGALSSSDLSLARLSTTGALDNGFGGDGTIRTDFPGYFATVKRVLDGGEDGYYAVGSYGTNSAGYMAIAAYDTTGQLRTDWGNGGLCLRTFGEDTSLIIYDGLMLPDGELLVAGTIVQGSPAQVVLFRVGTDGTLDETFGTGGMVLAPMGISANVRRIKLLPDGRIIGVGNVRTASDDYLGGALICRFLPDGTVDTSFAVNGFFQLEISLLSESFQDLAFLPDGRIAAAGTRTFGTPTTACLAAVFTADGVLDPTFAGTGYVVVDIANGIDALWGIAVDADERLVMAGVSEFGENGFDRALVMRYLMDGTPDPSFGTGGRFLYGEDLVSHRFYSVSLQDDGRIVAVGEGLEQFFAARLLPEAPNGVGAAGILAGVGLLYPNPVIDELRLPLSMGGDATYRIVDATGRAVLSGILARTDGTSVGTRIHLPADLSPGRYTVIVSHTAGRWIGSFIK